MIISINGSSFNLEPDSQTGKIYIDIFIDKGNGEEYHPDTIRHYDFIRDDLLNIQFIAE